MLAMLMWPTALSAEIQIHDYITPFIQAFRTVERPSAATFESLILQNEFLLSRELGSTYYNRLNESEKRELLQTNLSPFARALPTLIPVYDQKLVEVREIIVAMEERFKSSLNIELNFPVYLWVALENTDGKSTDINNTAGFSLNFRMLAESSKTELEILTSHEFFHVVQVTLIGTANEESVGLNLMSEGWATYVSSLVVPGSPDYKYVSYWLKDDSQFREFQRSEKEALVSLLKDFDKSGWSASRRYFSGNPKDSTPFPPRIGYYIGYKLAQRLARTLSVSQVVRIKFPQFKKVAKNELKKMLAEPK
ncbi:MAG: DUF2268 domain-containing putative Zn-dependent protease [Bdellovibrionales bacterium]